MSLRVKTVYSKSMIQVLTYWLEGSLNSSWEDVYSPERDLRMAGIDTVEAEVFHVRSQVFTELVLSSPLVTWLPPTTRMSWKPVLTQERGWKALTWKFLLGRALLPLQSPIEHFARMHELMNGLALFLKCPLENSSLGVGKQSEKYRT